MNNGFLNIIKPDGVTSFQVIAKVRKKLGIQKVGHLGTLDPAGVGVLPLAIGKATRLFNVMQDKVKQYYAIFVFGKQTDTLDSFGQVEIVEDNIEVHKNEIEKVLPSFVGEIEQLPPKYSAKKINGKRAYDLAREGKDFELKPKKIVIYDFSLEEQVEKNTFLFKIKCSSGTYIRSLCRDLANKLNTVAYMPLIIRSEVDSFSLNNGITLSEFLISDNAEKYIIPFDEVYSLTQITLDGENLIKVKNGMAIFYNHQNGDYYLKDENHIFAIGKVFNNKLKMEIYLDD